MERSTHHDTDCLHLMASFDAFYSICGEAIHVKKCLLLADIFSLQRFCNRTALVDGMGKESTVLSILRNRIILIVMENRRGA